MVVILYLLALAMIATGAAAGVFGAPYVQLERGWTMVIAGSVVASSGAVLLGLAFVAQRIRRVEREGARMRDQLVRLDAAAQLPARPARMAEGATAEAAAGALSLGGSARALDPSPEPPAEDAKPGDDASASVQEPGASPPLPPPDTHVIGTYASGGNDYVMYSDGSIHADTPSGHYRFASLEELKAFVAAGGERRPAATD